jgi:mannose-1-phosphate guanylyltransferase
MYAAILAGGVGTRLWPRSRQSQPKQFTDITGSGRTMIQATADRLDSLVDPAHLYIITGAPYAQLAATQLPNVPPSNILHEPVGRNTAPAVGLACIAVRRRNPHAVIAILPADHVILDTAHFRRALRRAAEAAQAGYIVTLGITPTHPHTGYGYIQRGDPLPDLPIGDLPTGDLPTGDLPTYAVQRFLEKPDLATAQSFLASGDFYWNGGIFVCRVDVMLDEITRQLPAMAQRLQRIDTAWRADPNLGAATLAAEWPSMPNISVDVGIMEHARAVATVPLQAGWNDIGSWDALEDVIQADDDHNCVAQGDLLAVESHGNIVYTTDKVVALIGVDNLVVVDTGDTLLIGQKRQMQKVRTVVERLQAQGRSDLL